VKKVRSQKSEVRKKKSDLTSDFCPLTSSVNPAPVKADAALAVLRTEEVLRIRLDGAQFHDILQYAAEKGWGLEERQIRTYMSRADDLLVERLENDRKKLIASHHARRESLYARAVNAADYRTALSILMDEAKLRGLYPSEKLEVNVPMTFDLNLMPDVKKRILLNAFRAVQLEPVSTDGTPPPA
jgi:hypothetical protein